MYDFNLAGGVMYLQLLEIFFINHNLTKQSVWLMIFLKSLTYVFPEC